MNTTRWRHAHALISTTSAFNSTRNDLKSTVLSNHLFLFSVKYCDMFAMLSVVCISICVSVRFVWYVVARWLMSKQCSVHAVIVCILLMCTCSVLSCKHSFMICNFELYFSKFILICLKWFCYVALVAVLVTFSVIFFCSLVVLQYIKLASTLIIWLID